MNVSKSQLYKIIVEEYLKEEGIELTEDKADDLLAWIKGGPKPKDLDYKKDPPTPPEVPPAPEKDDSSTFAMEVPAGSDMSDEEIIDSISRMIQGRDPEHVSELFQAVFAKIPGVEMGDSEPEPESLYSPGAEGRPVISLGPVREHLAAKTLEKIFEIAGLSYGTHSIAGVPGNRDDDEEMEEGHYRDMEDEGEVYDALDPHGFESMSDAELVDMMHTDGMEEMIVLDGEGDLANREEVIAALKDV